jgi:hypothetical protein
MARSVTIKQEDGNSARSAMVIFDMDGEVTVPSGWDVQVTFVSEQDDGTDVDASAAYGPDTTAVTANDAAMATLANAINTTATGAKAWISKNTPNQYVLNILPIGTADLINVTAAAFAASS